MQAQQTPPLQVLLLLDQSFQSNLLSTKIRDIPHYLKYQTIIDPIISGGSEHLKETIKFLDTRRDWFTILKFMNEHNSCHNPFSNVSISSLGFKYSLAYYRQNAFEIGAQLGKELKFDSNFIFQIVGISPGFIYNNSNEVIRNDREVVLRSVKGVGSMLSIASDRLKDDREIVMAAVKQDGGSLGYANDRFKSDREIVMAAAKSSGHALKFVHESLRNDREIVELAISHCWSFIGSAGEEIKNDREIIMKAIMRNEQGSAFQYASRELKLDKKFVLEVVRKSKGFALEYALEELIKDREFLVEILEIPERSSTSTFYIARFIKDDRDLILLTAKYDGFIIKYINPEFKKDKEIVFEAVSQNVNVFQHIDKSLRDDKEFVLRLARKNSKIIQFLTKSMKKDHEFMSQINKLN
ncbi:predicted protein [Naegleria gruberi]|uniref:Predicted protein n=1 Tax=Naegleria gruberi TaxID=5762 RepID=D2VYP4_NAEGR|nr:uncharacterized protein NAEGRDRAFT_74193 [Naegleria gruberi]EFC38147.1 predicted protein [Naegleria gruberi]|eukprot:XP_002670891.1 predicted protein [Naegleria gruberi strain NEG-M]